MKQLTWGPWVLIKEHLVLRHQGTAYEVYLDECKNSAQVLDWIAQISRKGIYKEDLADLVRALDAILDLQGHICGSGAGQTISLEKIKELVGGITKPDGPEEFKAKLEAAKKRFSALNSKQK